MTVAASYEGAGVRTKELAGVARRFLLAVASGGWGRKLRCPGGKTEVVAMWEVAALEGDGGCYGTVRWQRHRKMGGGGGDEGGG